MGLTFTSDARPPSNIRLFPGEFLRPAFGELYGFDADADSGAVPSGTFDTATLENGQTNLDNTNILTFTVQPSGDISAGDSITLAGLTGSQTADGSLTLSGAGASVFGSAGSWTQSSGTLVLTVDTGQTLSTGSDTVITFNLTNPATVSSGVSGVTLSSSGFTQASISGTFLNTVDTFNVTTRDTEANILASTPTNPSGEVNIAFGTDTNNFYIYDGSAWYAFNTDTFINTYSVDFDGTDDYMVISQDSSINITGDLTLSAWINLDSLGAFQGIITKRSSTTNYQFYIRNTNILSFFDGSNLANDTTALTTGSWIHVAVVVSGSSASFYRNGSFSSTSSGISVTSNTANLTIGDIIGGSFLNGKVDEVSVFDSALSASDITAIYNSGVPNDISSLNPVGWWRMGDNDGGTGTTITDQGSGGNDGTLTNGPTFSTTVPS